MKTITKNYLLFAICWLTGFTTLSAQTTDAFITIWTTTTPNESITIPTNPFYAYDYNVDWGDTTSDSNLSGNASHTYSVPGTHTVTISGTFPAINFGNSTPENRSKIINITQWGTGTWATMLTAFSDCVNLDVTAWDAPNLSGLTNIAAMFTGCTSLVGTSVFNTWDTSNVQNMFGVFDGASSFNQPLNNWNTGNTTNFSRMFREATSFDQDLSAWDVSFFIAGLNMFEGIALSTTNYDALLNSWAAQPLQTNVIFDGGNSRYCMGESARNTIISNNWIITDGGLDCSDAFITTWQTTTANESITIPTFNGETYNYSVNWGDGTIEFGFTGDAIHSYATPGEYTVTISGTFPRIFFNDFLNADPNTLKIREVQQWGTMSWSSMESAFMGCRNLNVTAIDTPNLSGVTLLARMFLNCESLVGNNAFNSWDTSNVTSMLNMFSGATLFNQNIGGWNTSNVTNIRFMFRDAVSFDQNLGGWNVSNVTTASNMFLRATLSTTNYDALLNGWASQSLQSGVSFHAGFSTYCLGEPGRNILTGAPNNWIISDFGNNCLDAFITTWRTTTPNESITIPTTGTGYNYTVDWGDGTIESGFTGNATHSYVTSGDYTVRIIGSFPRIFFNNGGDRNKIIAVTQWGSTSWTSMRRAFYGCSNLDVTATDVPDFSLTTDMSSMFENCSSLLGTSAFNNWNTSNVTDMYYMFNDAALFNQNLGNWDTGNVTVMSSMFSYATSFNQPIGTWNTGNVEYMNSMFYNATNFNQPLANWDTSNVTEFDEMFYEASSFNQPIGNWVTTNAEDMSGMFGYASSFNQPIGNWDTSNVTNMSQMFQEATAFNQPIGNWNTANVTDMDFMFLNCSLFNQDLSNWDTSNVDDMSAMFFGAAAFNQPIGSWDVGVLRFAWSMFEDAVSFNQDLGSWNTVSLFNANRMFEGATSFDQDLGNWNVTSLASGINMFRDVTLSISNYDALLNGWATQTLQPGIIFSAGNSQYCLGEAARNILTSAPNNWSIVDNGQNCSSISFITTWRTTTPNESIEIRTSVAFSYDYFIDWGDGTVEHITSQHPSHTYSTPGNHEVKIYGTFPAIRMSGAGSASKLIDINQWGPNQWASMDVAFLACDNLNVSATDTPDLSNVSTLNFMFANCSSLLGTSVMNNWDVSNVSTFIGTFEGATSFNQPIGNWNTGNATNMSRMFNNAASFNQPIGGWNVSNVTNMAQMFSSTTVFDQPIGNWNTGSVTDMYRMFFNATAFNQPIGGWNTSNVISMNSMFFNALSFNQDIGNWNTSNVTNMGGMFNQATAFNQALSNWDIANVANLSYMFKDATSFNQSIGSWNTSNVGTMNNMFEGAVAFNQDIGTWDISNLGFASNMFNGITLSIANYDALLIGWNTLDSGETQIPQNVTFNAGNSEYCLGESDRDSLISTHGWTITDGGGESIPPVAVCQDITVQLDASGTVSITAADIDGGSTDNCGIGSTSINVNNFTCSDLGTNQVILTITDTNGNTSNCTATVTVEDILVPSITCPSDIIVDTDLGDCGSVVFFADAFAEDNCFVTVNQTIGLPSGSSFPLGINTIEFTATDGNGNTSVCSFNIIVEDNEAPTAICQNITVQLDNTGVAIITPADVDGGSSDNCGVITSMSLDIDTFSCADVGLNNVVLTIIDDNGDSSTCTAVVTVEDATAPEVTCTNITVELGADGTATIVPDDVIDTLTDNCEIGTTAVDINSFNCGDIGAPVIVELLVSDIYGNVASCTTTVTVIDTLAPEIFCPTDLTVEVPTGEQYSIPDYFANSEVTVADNCTDPVKVITQSPSPGTLLDPGVYDVIVNVEDNQGNSTSCTFELTIDGILSVGASEPSISNVVMYPNPAVDYVRLSNPQNIEFDLVSIYDITGKLVLTFDLSNTNSDQQLNIASLPSATYFVLISGRFGQVTRQLIKR